MSDQDEDDDVPGVSAAPAPPSAIETARIATLHAMGRFQSYDLVVGRERVLRVHAPSPATDGAWEAEHPGGEGQLVRKVRYARPCDVFEAVIAATDVQGSTALTVRCVILGKGPRK